ncbi:hypothetical protein NE637_14390, partial [Desulfovibrio desulfuricans]|uniref:hypothetical protein n=1 Tax=Desulfovibrio desulfuricans TaxID=876 RepID=UPI00210EBADA
RNVLMYVSIKIPALTHSGRKTRILQIHSTPAIASAFAPASLRKATPQPAFDGEWTILTRNFSACLRLN